MAVIIFRIEFIFDDLVNIGLYLICIREGNPPNIYLAFKAWIYRIGNTVRPFIFDAGEIYISWYFFNIYSTYTIGNILDWHFWVFASKQYISCSVIIICMFDECS